MSFFTAIVSAMLHANHSLTSAHSRKGILQKFIDTAEVIDPLAPAFIIRKKKSSKVKSHFELLLWAHEAPIANFMDRASHAGLVKGRQASYQSLLDHQITTHLLPREDIYAVDEAVWSKILVCAVHGISPSQAVLDRPLRLTHLTPAPMKHCFPLDEKSIGIVKRLASNSRPGAVIGLPVMAHAAATKGAAEFMVQLLAHGHDVNESNPANGVTPLHVAAVRGNIEAARHLLAAGADLEAKDRLGRTPAQWIELDEKKDADAVRQAGAEFQALADASQAMRAIDAVLKGAANNAQATAATARPARSR